ncbi:hypothetical protein CXB51_021082 [Gossypium anomalum]|uniref:RNase H type-1 domain-containing protein n=1 Tax=Gossypium anomalum TaxID=47600 RepID=A0A8J6CUN9_9ROSI|nr:hypothetical protein CXB51_021082 [Gossypium anomalum]
MLAFDIELWGILDDLTLLQKWGVDRILIQTDSSVVVQAIQGKNLESSSSALIAKITPANVERVNVLTTTFASLIEVINNGKGSGTFEIVNVD